MSTAETIVAVIALAAARGTGTLLKSWLDRSQSRRKREAPPDLAEALMRSQEIALAKASVTCEALRAELSTRHDDHSDEAVHRSLADLTQVLGELDALQGVQHRQIRGWLDPATHPVHPHR